MPLKIIKHISYNGWIKTGKSYGAIGQILELEAINISHDSWPSLILCLQVF
jgi:hypothetical protein